MQNFLICFSHGVPLSVFSLPLLLQATLTTWLSAAQDIGYEPLCLLQMHTESVSQHSPAQLLESRTALSSHSATALILHIPYDHIAVNLTYHNLGEELLTFPKRRPREFNAILATLKTWMADMAVQCLEIQRKGPSWTFDYRRSATFAIFGLVYIGLVQWLLYVTVLTWLFPHALAFANAPLAMKVVDLPGQWDMAGQILVDNLVFQLLVYFPAFYTIKAVVQSSGSVPLRVQKGLSAYWANIGKDNMVSCALWVPADLFIFACPMYLRMPLEHSFSFGWTMFISFMRGGADDKSEKHDKGSFH